MRIQCSIFYLIKSLKASSLAVQTVLLEFGNDFGSDINELNPFTNKFDDDLVLYFTVSKREMSNNSKWIEMIDKENTKFRPTPSKKDKNTQEEPQIKKKILGEASNTVFVVEEPTSPDDSRLLKRKREMSHTSCADFVLNLNSS